MSYVQWAITVNYIPQRAAQRISELNLFLYLRISGVSLCGRVFTGFTFTTEPLRDGLSRRPSLLKPVEKTYSYNQLVI